MFNKRSSIPVSNPTTSNSVKKPLYRYNETPPTPSNIFTMNSNVNSVGSNNSSNGGGVGFGNHHRASISTTTPTRNASSNNTSNSINPINTTNTINTINENERNNINNSSNGVGNLRFSSTPLKLSSSNTYNNALNIPVTPILKNSNSHVNNQNITNNQFQQQSQQQPHQYAPPRRSVTMSAKKPSIHTYPTSPVGSLDSNSNNINNITSNSSMDVSFTSFKSTPGGVGFQTPSMNGDFEIDDTMSNISSLSYLNETQFPDNDNEMSTISAESVYANSTASTPRKRAKSSIQKLKDLISLPIDKYFMAHEELIVFLETPLYKTVIFSLCIFLNTCLFFVSVELLNKFIGTMLCLISLFNAFRYFNAKKTIYLYRYKGTTFKSPNMYIETITTPSGSTDNVVVLDKWNPSFTCRTIFIYFSPLHVLTMLIAGPDLDRFIIMTIVSIFIVFGIKFLHGQFEGRIRDESIVFGQLCGDYNHFYKPRAFTFDKSTQC